MEKSGDLLRVPRFVPLRFNVSRFGIWRITLSTDTALLGNLDLMVKRAGVQTQ